MSLFRIPALAAIAIVLLVVYRFIIQPAFLSPLAKIPAANWTTHISSLWINWIRYTNTENRTIYELHKKKGPIVRTGPNELSVNCFKEGLHTIYGGGFPKTNFYYNRFTNYGVPPMFAMVDKKEHSERKRMMSNVYSKSYIFANPTCRSTTKTILFDRFMPIIHKSAEAGKPLEVLHLSYAYSMDTFMAYQLGLKNGSNLVGNEKEREWYLRQFFSRRPWMFWSTEHPNLTNFLEKIGIRLIPKWCDVGTVELENWNLEKCDSTEKMLSENSHIPVEDIPVVYAQERAAIRKWGGKTGHSEKQPYRYRLEIASDAYDHNAAAHETSGDTLAYLYYALSLRPDLQAQLRSELLTLSPPITYPPTSPDQPLPDFKAVDSLPLLDAVLNETLRLWCSVPGGQPRKTPYPSCKLAGYDNIPPNVRVQSAAYTMHRNEEVFPDPESWKPERWLDATPEQLTQMRHHFWAWGSGGQMCIGSNIATHDMKHAIAGIYTNYTSTVVPTEGMDMEQAEGFTSGPKGNKVILQFKHI